MDLLLEHLYTQKRIFEDIDSLQEELLKRLASQEMSSVLELLGKKNALLDQMKKNNALAKPLVDSWPARRRELEGQPIVLEVNGVLECIEAMAQKMRKLDEEMMCKLDAGAPLPPTKPADRQQHSQNMLNAFRAMR